MSSGYYVSRVALPTAITALVLLLLYSSIRTFRELDEQRAVYLRHRISLLAARLENLPAGLTRQAVWEALSDEEPALSDVEILANRAHPDSDGLAALWDGRELFRTEFRRTSSGEMFRAAVLFHSAEGPRIARVDLDASAADFLVVHARHNVIFASLAGLVLVTLSVYTIWVERRAARIQVHELQMEHLARLGKMSAVMAHEIRNPLGAIKGFVQLAGERVDHGTGLLLRRAVSETERLEHLVKDLLAYGRPPDPVVAAADWCDLANRLNAHGRRMIGERPIQFHATERSLVWQTDAALLEQALLNLLQNAIEAIPPSGPGQVEMDIGTPGSNVVITVTDSGPGIPDAVKTRLFEPFFTTKASGTGLGLATTRGLIQSLGGEINLQNRQAGGTIATIRLPRSGYHPDKDS